MKSETKLLLGLGIGLALGATIGYMMGSDKKENGWNNSTNLPTKLKPI